MAKEEIEGETVPLIPHLSKLPLLLQSLVQVHKGRANVMENDCG